MEYNNLILNALSIYLNEYECSITPSQIKKVMECGVDELFAYKLLYSIFFKLCKKVVHKISELLFNFITLSFISLAALLVKVIANIL